MPAEARSRPAPRRRLPWLLAASALLFSGCGVHGLGAEQSPLVRFLTPKSGRIAYVGVDGNVRVSDQAGSSRPLTNDGGSAKSAGANYLSPTWSPDGKRLAFIRYERNGGSEAELLVAARDGRGSARVLSSTELQPLYLYWAPNGRAIAVLSSVRSTGGLELGLVPTVGAGGYRRLDAGSPYYWVWASDGRSLVAHTRTEPEPGGSPGGSRVSILAIGDSVSARRVDVAPGAFQAPDASPRGKLLLLATGPIGHALLVLADRSGRTRRELARLSGSVSFAFAPDGRRVAYIEATDSSASNGRLRVVDLGAPRRSFTAREAPVVGFYWSPDGRFLAFFTPLLSSAAIGPTFARSPGLPYVQLMVLDVRSRSTWLVSRFPAAEGLLSSLPFNDQFQRSSTIWSPNGRSLVFTAYTESGEPGVFVAPADGNFQPAMIGEGDFASWSPR